LWQYKGGSSQVYSGSSKEAWLVRVYFRNSEVTIFPHFDRPVEKEKYQHLLVVFYFDEYFFLGLQGVVDSLLFVLLD